MTAGGSAAQVQVWRHAPPAGKRVPLPGGAPGHEYAATLVTSTSPPAALTCEEPVPPPAHVKEHYTNWQRQQALYRGAVPPGVAASLPAPTPAASQPAPQDSSQSPQQVTRSPSTSPTPQSVLAVQRHANATARQHARSELLRHHAAASAPIPSADTSARTANDAEERFAELTLAPDADKSAAVDTADDFVIQRVAGGGGGIVGSLNGLLPDAAVQGGAVPAAAPAVQGGAEPAAAPAPSPDGELQTVIASRCAHFFPEPAINRL